MKKKEIEVAILKFDRDNVKFKVKKKKKKGKKIDFSSKPLFSSPTSSTCYII
jgi:hypothetical protein